jgi:hypothetical protein
MGYTFNEETKFNLSNVLDSILNGIIIEEPNESDVEFRFFVVGGNVKSLSFKLIPLGIAFENNEGAFFKYLHKTDLDLSRYGIYNKMDKDNYNENCFIQSLIMSEKLTEENINYIKSMLNSRMIPSKEIKKICEKLNLNIIIHCGDNQKNKKFNNEGEIKIDLCLVDKHYFIFDRFINITGYALSHYNEIKHIKNWQRIYNNKLKKKKTKGLSSLELVKRLLLNKDTLLKEITLSDEIQSSTSYEKITKIENLNYNQNSCKLVEYEESKERLTNYTNDNVIFFDFETTTDGIHEPYLVRWITAGGKKPSKSVYGRNCGYHFLQSIKEDSVLIAHNLGYDFRFLFKYLKQIFMIPKNNSIMEANGVFYNKELNKNIKVYLKDSYCFITDKLKSFPEMFYIKNIRKEVMPYSIYNKESVKNKLCSIEYAKEFINNEDDKIQFEKNIDEWNLRVDKKYFLHLKYSEKYCDIDCEILRIGYLKFREWMLEITEIDINNVTSLASLADKYIKKQGCYEGCYEFSGVIREFISKSAIGGRCMSRDNKKYHIKKENIDEEIIEENINDNSIEVKIKSYLDDFDAVSLYPSAMSKIGFLKGKPKILETTDFNQIKNYDGYFIEIKVTEVGKDRHFPLLNEKNDEGIRIFSNNIPTNNLIVDKITLEDLITYQNIKFEVIRGYYFNDGFNNQIKDTIKYLFEERKKKKREGNPIQNMYKLLMNSAYGKTIMKPVDCTRSVFDNDKWQVDKEREKEPNKKFYEKIDKYIIKNYNHIKYFSKVDGCDKYIINEVKPIDEHFSRPHIGANILSMSKRIMNEVMCLAEDLNIFIAYQDTDSMHILGSQVKKLEEEFNKKFNRNLIGSDLGQFHCDFDGTNNKGKNSEIAPTSIEAYILGKKTYIDKLLVKYDGKEQNKFHIRMKGVPNCSILSKGDPMITYKDLFEGQEKEFNLLAGGKVKFEFQKNFSIKSTQEFTRKIKF